MHRIAQISVFIMHILSTALMPSNELRHVEIKLESLPNVLVNVVYM